MHVLFSLTSGGLAGACPAPRPCEVTGPFAWGCLGPPVVRGVTEVWAFLRSWLWKPQSSLRVLWLSRPHLFGFLRANSKPY